MPQSLSAVLFPMFDWVFHTFYLYNNSELARTMLLTFHKAAHWMRKWSYSCVKTPLFPHRANRRVIAISAGYHTICIITKQLLQSCLLNTEMWLFTSITFTKIRRRFGLNTCWTRSWTVLRVSLWLFHGRGGLIDMFFSSVCSHWATPLFGHCLWQLRIERSIRHVHQKRVVREKACLKRMKVIVIVFRTFGRVRRKGKGQLLSV